VPDQPDQPLLPFDPPLAAAGDPGPSKPDVPELGADTLTARLFEEFARRSARLDKRSPAKPSTAA
jgi:hypothetical protein